MPHPYANLKQAHRRYRQRLAPLSAADLEFLPRSAKAELPLPASPDAPALRGLLLRCLESHYGSLEGCVIVPGQAEQLLREIRERIESAGY